jgi:hypothetical protein
MFDRGHIVEYRARQGWSLVLAVTTLTSYRHIQFLGVGSSGLPHAQLGQASGAS